LARTSHRFLACSFDTKGLLNFEFDTGLINPKGGSLLTHPRGAHFLLRGSIGFPLGKNVKGGGRKELGEVSVTGSFGMYSELEVNGEKTADVVKVFSESGYSVLKHHCCTI
jgi:hypothetical protein